MCVHHELSYASEVPSLMLFACLVAPTNGGATPLADGAAALGALPRDLFEPFERQGWLMAREQPDAIGAHGPLAVASRRSAGGGQHPHRPRETAVRGTARKRRRSRRRRAAGGRGMMDAVQFWCVRLDVAPPPETYYATLSDDERNRSAGFRFERDRRRFVVARGVLRDLLGRYLDTNPGQIRFVCNAFGKPELHPEFGGRGGLKFNLSHSGDLALIAIARDAWVGVDVECIERRGESNYADVARSFFSASEVDALSRVPSDLYAKAFFNCWTMKEAYVKGRGEGLTIPLTSFSVPITTDPAPAPVRCGRWSLFTLQPAPGYVGALAVSARMSRRSSSCCARIAAITRSINAWAVCRVRGRARNSA